MKFYIISSLHANVSSAVLDVKCTFLSLLSCSSEYVTFNKVIHVSGMSFQ
jgi:hypothetical protein